MTKEQLVSSLGSIAGEAQVRAESEEIEAAIRRGEWGNRPVAVVAPAETAQIAELVRFSEREGVAIIPAGGATRLHTGYPPSSAKPCFVLSTARLNRITDFQPDDLTVTCEPGATLADVQASLVTQEPPRKLMLALDAPLAERSTLGGIVSSGSSGFWRSAYGAPRDLLIGLQAVMSEGVGVKGGGRVVKNVAGYDVCKLFTSAWGTMGILTELTFRLRTRPVCEQTLAYATPDLATAHRLGFELHHAHLAIAYLLATNELDGTPMLLIGLQGSAERVQWQAEECGGRIRKAGVVNSPLSLSPEQVKSLLDRQARLDDDAALAVRASLLPDSVEGALKKLDPSLATTAQCATGILSIAAPQADSATLRSLLAAFPAEANLLWNRIPAALREQENVSAWGAVRGEFFLHRALKTSLDPHNVFSPERFHGKI